MTVTRGRTAPRGKRPEPPANASPRGAKPPKKKATGGENSPAVALTGDILLRPGGAAQHNSLCRIRMTSLRGLRRGGVEQLTVDPQTDFFRVSGVRLPPWPPIKSNTYTEWAKRPFFICTPPVHQPTRRAFFQASRPPTAALRAGHGCRCRGSTRCSRARDAR